jgi:hypothetical protein
MSVCTQTEIACVAAVFQLVPELIDDLVQCIVHTFVNRGVGGPVSGFSNTLQLVEQLLFRLFGGGIDGV